MKTLILPLAVLTAVVSSPVSARMAGGGGALAGFDGADRNGDGIVTRDEFAASRVARFDTMDRNGDGVVTKDDFKRLARFRPEAVERLEMLISQGDANGDGRLTRAELQAAPMPVFDRVDVNRDGKVDKQELERAREALADMKAARN